MFVHFIPAMSLLVASVQTPPDSAGSLPAPFRVFPQQFKIDPLPLEDRWAVQTNDERCGMAAWTKTADGGSLGMWAIHPVTTDDYMLSVIVPIHQPVSAEVTKPQLRITGSKLEQPIEKPAYVNRVSVEGLEVLTLKLNRQQMDGILASRELTIDRDSDQPVRIELANDGAMSRLLECERDGLKAAGLDPDLPKKFSQWPSFGTPPWGLFSDYDYPVAEQARGIQGKVQVRLDVDTIGRAESCRVVKTSASSALDLKTCEVLLRRAKLAPALDKVGKPVAAPVLVTVNWKLSQ